MDTEGGPSAVILRWSQGVVRTFDPQSPVAASNTAQATACEFFGPKREGQCPHRAQPCAYARLFCPLANDLSSWRAGLSPYTVAAQDPHMSWNNGHAYHAHEPRLAPTRAPGRRCAAPLFYTCRNACAILQQKLLASLGLKPTLNLYDNPPLPSFRVTRKPSSLVSAAAKSTARAASYAAITEQGPTLCERWRARAARSSAIYLQPRQWSGD